MVKLPRATPSGFAARMKCENVYKVSHMPALPPNFLSLLCTPPASDVYVGGFVTVNMRGILMRKSHRRMAIHLRGKTGTVQLLCLGAN